MRHPALLVLHLALVAHLAAAEPVIERISFCSCIDQQIADPFPPGVLIGAPQVFIFAGDNVYADGVDMALKRAAYAKLGALPVFRQVRERCTVLATWDDHDYGFNDVGGEYPQREASQKLFVDFWGDAPDAPRRTRPGIYAAREFGPADRRLQIILLDTRYFRSPLATAGNADADLLGAEQWTWLAQELAKPAVVRLVVSSIQFSSANAGGETWARYAHQRARLVKLIAGTRAGGVIFLSGDRHFAELNRLAADAPYPLLDLTSSSVSRPPVKAMDRPNANRVGELRYENNVGQVTIAWERDPLITLRAHHITDGTVLIERQVKVSELQVR